ncbi:hypothetical protein B0H13DRAFT_2122259, partial [Mycena leptocephala]
MLRLSLPPHFFFFGSLSSGESASPCLPTADPPPRIKVTTIPDQAEPTNSALYTGISRACVHSKKIGRRVLFNYKNSH